MNVSSSNVTMNTEQVLLETQPFVAPPTEEPVPIGDATVDFTRWEVCHADGERFSLSRCEAQLLAYLVQKAGLAVSREELLERVWGLDPARTTTRTIDMHIVHLRKKLRHTPEQPRLLTVRSKGYRLTQS